MPTYEQAVKRQPGFLKIVELFETVQGEGERIGVASTFVRTGACNLECPGCDTKWDRWNETSVPDVAAKVKALTPKHVVLSGGEPTLWQEDLAYLISLLPGYHITVESNGSIPITDKALLSSVHLWSFSPKVGSLGHNEKFSRSVVLQNITMVGRERVQLKYVLNPDIEEHVESVLAFQDMVDLLRPETSMDGLFDFSAVRDDRVYFQPYDTETLVNIMHQPGLDDVSVYLKRLSKLSSLVFERSKGRFRVLPQMHKLLVWR